MSFSSQLPFAEVLGSELLLNGLSFSPFRGCFGQVIFPQFSIVDSKTVQRSALCRSRRELSKEGKRSAQREVTPELFLSCGGELRDVEEEFSEYVRYC